MLSNPGHVHFSQGWGEKDETMLRIAIHRDLGAMRDTLDKPWHPLPCSSLLEPNINDVLLWVHGPPTYSIGIHTLPERKCYLNVPSL